MQPTTSAQSIYAQCHALQRSGRFAAALALIEENLKKTPDSPLFLKHKALTLWLMQRFADARATFLHLAKVDASPDYGRCMAGFMALLISDKKQGFEDYAFRPNIRELSDRFSARFPKWNGEPLSGKKLLLWGEQGIGDIIMFAGFIPWLEALGARLTLLVTPKLAPLFARSFPQAEVLAEFSFKEKAPYDFHFPMGDLMQIALPLYKPADHGPFLRVDAEKVKRLRARYLSLAAATGRTKLVGLTWFTSNADVGFTRNIPLTDFAPLFALPQVQFVSLQYGDHKADIDAVNRQYNNALLVDPKIDAFDDIEGLAAQIMAMDEVAGTSNAGLHLAGALGAKTTLLVPASPDWRWGLSGDRTPWYSSMKMIRQEKLLEWKPVVAKWVCEL